MYDITSLGELLVDFTEAGRSAAGQRLFEQNAGGAVANLLAAAARCGAKTAFIGKVGDDMHGRFLKCAMEEVGVDMQHLAVTKDAFTTLAFVALDNDGERTFSFARKPGADTLLSVDELPVELLTHTRIFHTGSLSLTDEPARTATVRAIRIAKGAGATITFDPNYRAGLWRSRSEAVSAMRSLIKTADIIKLSDTEAELMTDSADHAEAARLLALAGVAIVLVTLGGDGVLVRVGNETRHIPAFRAKVVDTTGAGDAFLGGFLYRLLQIQKRAEDVSIAEACDCARFGNAVASICIERRGGIPAMPSLDDVQTRLIMP